MTENQHTPNPSVRQALLDLAERCERARLFVQDSIENGHDRTMLGNLFTARDEIDAVIAALRARAGEA